MKDKTLRKLGRLVAPFLILAGALAMQDLRAATSSTTSAGDGFGVSTLGGHQYGTNGIGVWLPRTIHVGLSDTIERDFNGVGVIENQLSPDDAMQAKDIHGRLCAVAGTKSATSGQAIDPATSYSVNCSLHGQPVLYQGQLEELPGDLASSLRHFFTRAQENYVRDGRVIAKLDVAVESLVREQSNLVISVKFTNGGDYPMITSSPDRWSNAWGDELLNVSGQSKDKQTKWEISLAGQPLVNKSDFPEENVTIPARSSVIFKFLAAPNVKLRAGIYEFHVQVFMDIGGFGPVGTMGKTDFHSDYKNPYRVTFDRDYPSTPQEWKDFESRKAKEVSFLMPGATVAESGYYRATSITGTRDQFVKKFEQGTAAPDLDFQRWDRWEWETDLARATICKPGETCPREGRWVLRAKDFSYNSKGDITYSQYEQRFRIGEQLPAVDIADVAGPRLFWEWMSA